MVYEQAKLAVWVVSSHITPRKDNLIMTHRIYYRDSVIEWKEGDKRVYLNSNFCNFNLLTENEFSEFKEILSRSYLGRNLEYILEKGDLIRTIPEFENL